MNNIQIKCLGLTSFQLKMIAIAAMLIDHIGAVLYPEIPGLRCIGRLSFPIFCFLLAEGFCHTGNIKQYLMRLGIFAVLSEIPYDLALRKRLFVLEKQNVFFTLFLGLCMLWGISMTKIYVEKILLIIIVMWLAEFLHTDYGFRGILLIGLFYLVRENRTLTVFTGALWNFYSVSRIQYWGSFSSILIGLYNGQKGKNIKYFFYLFYPLHLLILYSIWKIRIWF